MSRSLNLLTVLGAMLLLVQSPVFASESSSALRTPEAAFEMLASEQDLSETEIGIVESTMLRASKTSPKDGRWVMGKALIAKHRGDSKKAYEHAKKAIKLSPDHAKLQYLFGNTAFGYIGEVSFLNKGAVAKKGRKAFERAIELDPTLIEPHIGLAQYYLYAPGIAGGSVKKARKMATAIDRIDGGAADAAALRMQIEGKEENWDEFAKAAEEAVGAAEDLDKRQEIRVQLAYIQIFQAKHLEKGRATIEQIRAEEIPADQLGTVNFLDGYCRIDAGDDTGAIECFKRTLAVNKDARSTRQLLASCYERAGEYALAAEQHEEFAKRFSDDDRAKDSKKRAKKLRAKVSNGG